MLKTTHTLLLSLFILSLVSLVSCADDNVSSSDFGIFSSQDASTAIMDGVIGSDTPEHWDNFISEFPGTNKIVMKNCPGSEDDVANLQAARKIRNQAVEIHLPADAEIASGAVDMFLAGTTRTREVGSKIGVHSWSNGTNDATEFPVGDEEHQSYIDYYVEMGFSQTDAEAFYYFTINAAPPTEIHWMTDDEIKEYKLLKD